MFHSTFCKKTSFKTRTLIIATPTFILQNVTVNGPTDIRNVCDIAKKLGQFKCKTILIVN